MGVTWEILWDVTDDMLKEHGFDEFDIMRFSNARKFYHEGVLRGQGKTFRFYNYTIFNKTTMFYKPIC